MAIVLFPLGPKTITARLLRGLKKQDRHTFPGFTKDPLLMKCQSSMFPAGKMSQSRAVNGYDVAWKPHRIRNRKRTQEQSINLDRVQNKIATNSKCDRRRFENSTHVQGSLVLRVTR